ncbi:MAG: class I SAM-dependent methyltransferase [Spirirestis rafaelensis WJT71-NPBG6]|jgi:hypothetical protein|nr:class I SAM-dependent methyltransferase [Spirirestis rafaelensis WJT71-NPBG6]
MNILDYYITSTPSIQNALNIFKEEWTSKLPGDLASLQAGQLPLFEDSRIEWAVKQLGGVEGKRILELGPLEAAHTYMLEQMGAASITSVESNTRAYLKCLIIKEVMQLKHAHFLCGDFVEYLRSNPGKFDICFACGVLYHMANPAELISLIAKVSDQVFLWTHYYDHEIISRQPNHAHRFPNSISAEHDGFKHTLYRQEYSTALNSMSFCGGSNKFSYWMSREDILASLRHVGLSDIQVYFDKSDHPAGPDIALTAARPVQQGLWNNEIFNHPEIVAHNDSLPPLVQQIPLQLQANQVELERSQSQLQATQVELERLQALIDAMKTSKFWKIRTQWFKLKKLIGFKTD